MTKVRNLVAENPPAVIEGSFVEQNEIDLIEIFFVLLEQKKTIFFVTMLFVIAGLLLGISLPQKWTSTSVIVAPTETETIELDNLLNDLKVAGVQTDIDPSYLLTTYMQFFDSRVLREVFLQNSAYFKFLMKKYPDNEFENRRLLNDISTNNITTSSNTEDKSTSAKIYQYFRLNISAQTPDEAKILLQGYMDYVEKAVNNYLIFKIQRLVALKLDAEQVLFTQEMQKIQSNRGERIKRLEYALSIADAAGIQKPVYSNGGNIHDDPDYPITLGAEALKQKLNVERTITDPLTMSSDLRDRKMNIDFLHNIKISAINFKPFKYLQRPEIPTKKDEPKRLIILVISTLVGLLLAIAIALLRNVLAKRHEIT